MTNRYFTWKNLLLFGAMLCLGGSAMMAQPQRPGNPPMPPPRDALGVLSHALSEAGAPALSAQQEQQLTQLVETMREQRPAPGETLQAAQRAYDSAVLAGNLAAANAQADLIAQQISADASQHLRATAKFKIEALNILKSNASQMTALTQRFGTAGLAHLLDALAGGPGHPGGPGQPGHPPGPRPDGPPPPHDGRGPAERP